MPRTVSTIGFVPFMSPTLVDGPPDGDEWLHEVKFNGYRTQLVIEAGQVRAYPGTGSIEPSATRRQ